MMARPRKRSTFTARDKNFAAKLEMKPTVASDPTAEQGASKPTPAIKKISAALESDTSTENSAQNSPPENIPNAQSESETAPVETSPQQGSHANASERIRVNFFWPDELVKRATPWAQKAKCTPKLLLQRGWQKSKAGLVARLSAGIRHADIPTTRPAAGTAGRLDTTIALSPAAFARLKKELDPEGVIGIGTPISTWVSHEIVAPVSEYLKEAGY